MVFLSSREDDLPSDAKAFSVTSFVKRGFVVGSLPCSERFFSGYSGFPLSLKTNTFKFQFDLERTDTFQRVLMNSLVLRG